MRHAKSRLTIHQLVDGQNGKDGLTPQPNLLRDAHLPLTLGAWQKNTNNGGTINFESNVVPPITGVNVWAAFAAPQSESYGELYQHLSFISGKTYTFSVYAKGANSGWFITWPIGVHRPLYESKQVEENGLPDGWKRYAVTFTADKSGDANAYLRSWFQGGQRMSGKVYFAAPKLEEGRVATPWLRAQSDFKGDDGVGVSAVLSEYAVSSSENSAPSSGWSTTLPTWQQGQYLWTRSRVTFTDGRVVTTTPQVDSAWKKLSELAYEQAHMAYLKQVFEQRAGIEGGLLFGSMLQMRDIPIGGSTNGEVAAYLSGLRSTKVGNTPRPALALGVSNFGTARESEVIGLHHNGSGHIGGLNFSQRKDDGKSILYISDETGVERVNFSGDGMPTIDQLVSRATVTGTIPATSISVYGKNLSDYWDVAQSGESPFFRATRATGTLRCRFRLYKRGANHSPCILTLILKHRGANYHQPVMTLGQVTEGVTSKDFNLDIPANLYPGEEYDLALVLSGYKAFDATGMLIMYSDLTYTQTNQDPYTGMFANGLMAYHSPSQYTYIKDGKLTIKGEMSMPGIIASGRVSIEGQLETKWGKAIRAWRRSTGEYLIYHTIGHTNYSIVITPLGNGNLMQGQLAAHTGDVAWCYLKDVQNGCRMVNTPFTFAILAW
jgi:hypothetical protein